MLHNIQIKILDPSIGTKVPVPSYQTTGSAGIDLYACSRQSISLQPNHCILINTGLSVFIKNPQYCGIIAPRSGIGHKKGIVLGNLVGIIDADYQGELKVSCWNRSTETQIINPYDRIAQLLFVPVFRPTLEIVSEYEETERGEGGFGSTGS